MAWRWTFQDTDTLETYELELNPSEGGTPGREKPLNYVSTSAPDGTAIIFEGQEQPKEVTVSGVILTETHFNAIVAWYERRVPILLTDDLSRQYRIYIKAFEPKRVRAIQHPWKHDYQMTYVVLEEL